MYRPTLPWGLWIWDALSACPHGWRSRSSFPSSFPPVKEGDVHRPGELPSHPPGAGPGGHRVGRGEESWVPAGAQHVLPLPPAAHRPRLGLLHAQPAVLWQHRCHPDLRGGGHALELLRHGHCALGAAPGQADGWVRRAAQLGPHPPKAGRRVQSTRTFRAHCPALPCIPRNYCRSGVLASWERCSGRTVKRAGQTGPARHWADSCLCYFCPRPWLALLARCRVRCPQSEPLALGCVLSSPEPRGTARRPDLRWGCWASSGTCLPEGLGARGEIWALLLSCDSKGVLSPASPGAPQGLGARPGSGHCTPSWDAAAKSPGEDEGQACFSLVRGAPGQTVCVSPVLLSQQIQVLKLGWWISCSSAASSQPWTPWQCWPSSKRSM